MALRNDVLVVTLIFAGAQMSWEDWQRQWDWLLLINDLQHGQLLKEWFDLNLKLALLRRVQTEANTHQQKNSETYKKPLGNSIFYLQKTQISVHGTSKELCRRDAERLLQTSTRCAKLHRVHDVLRGCA